MLRGGSSDMFSALLHLDGEGLWEFCQEALHRPGAGFAKGTDRAARDIVSHIQECGGILCNPITCQHPGGHFVHPETSLAARCALSAALVSIELIEVIERPEHVAGIIHDDHSTATDHGAGGCQGGGIH